MTRPRWFYPLLAAAWAGLLPVDGQAATAPLPREEAAGVSAQAIVNLARDHLQAALAQRFAAVQVHAVGQPGGINLPAGALQAQVREGQPLQVATRMPVWVDLYAQGRRVKSLAVTMDVRVSQPVYLARRGLAEGTAVAAADFEFAMADVTQHADGLVAQNELQGGARLRRSLPAGEPLRRDHLAANDGVLRGDKVTLLYRTGAVEVETRATAQQSGQPGNWVRVKPEGGADTVPARVVEAGVVAIEERDR